MDINKQKTILIAVVGLSPAVITNTAWVLATQYPELIPDEVVAITTKKGSRCIENELLACNGWERLHQQLIQDGFDIDNKLHFGSRDSMRVIGDGKIDFDDIVTPKQNDVTADFILKVLRQYSEDSGTRIIASIAGGRKSMSALMLSCMSLLGRKQDMVCHVLVNEPYEQRLEPSFLFPEKDVIHKMGENTYLSTDANPMISEIPFVRMRGWYEKEFNTVPPSYMQLVNKVQGIAPEPVNYPCVRLDTLKGILQVGDVSIDLSAAEFALIYVIFNRLKRNELPTGWFDLDGDFVRLLQLNVPITINWFHTFKEAGQPDSEDFRKWASSARTKLRKALCNPMLADLLLPSIKRRNKHTYPADKIIVGKLTDVSRRHETSRHNGF